MSRPSRPPAGDIPRNLSYIAGLYERAYYRTARPSIEEHDEAEEGVSSPGLSCTVKAQAAPRRWRSRSAPALRVSRVERHRSPETRKRVRFADALGLELESVRHFRREDMPCIPQHVTYRLQKELLEQLGGSCIAREHVKLGLCVTTSPLLLTTLPTLLCSQAPSLSLKLVRLPPFLTHQPPLPHTVFSYCTPQKQKLRRNRRLYRNMDLGVKTWHVAGLMLAITCCTVISSVTGCNKALCASDVSKCLLQELCQCNIKEDDCPCCQDCMMCLGSLWDQCCSCVGLCSENKGSQKHAARRSSLEVLPVPLPSLFQSLSELQGDAAMDWSVHTLPVTKELSQKSNQDHILLGAHTAVPPPSSVNTSAICTVMYFKTCMSMRRCHETCEFTGSSRYRWFHNGCCQCVGPDCYGYGSKEAMCQQCHPKGILVAGEADTK